MLVEETFVRRACRHARSISFYFCPCRRRTNHMLGSKTEQRGEAEYRRNRDASLQEADARRTPPTELRSIFGRVRHAHVNISRTT